MFWNGSTTSDGLSGSGSGGRSAALRRTRNTRILAAMFFSSGSPRSSTSSAILPDGVLAHAGRNADAAGFGQRLQPRRDDHAIAHQVVALGHHLALVHADAQPQAVGLGAQPVLDGDGAAQRLHRTGELDEKAVAGGLEQPARMLGASGSMMSVRSARTPRQRARLVRCRPWRE